MRPAGALDQQYLAAIPPGSDVFIGYFIVGYSPLSYYVEAWNHENVTTVRVGKFSALTLTQFDEVSGEGLLIVASDLSAATIDANLPTFGHLLARVSAYSGGRIFQRSGGGGPYQWELNSPTGQLIPPAYRFTGSISDQTFVTLNDGVYGRDSVGVSFILPI
ncbi:MAG: hypothetical protein ABR507_03700 [Actinomycetota bacterium]|nr:hypothetical protein [Actinomycetota bacterium]